MSIFKTVNPETAIEFIENALTDEGFALLHEAVEFFYYHMNETIQDEAAQRATGRGPALSDKEYKALLQKGINIITFFHALDALYRATPTPA